MKTREKICEVLRSSNPFASVSAGDPRQFKFPDVVDVDRNVFEALIGVITQKSNEPTMTCAAAVIGEAGSGKTQLIGRLVEYGGKGKTRFNFAYIHPFVDPYQGYRYLLKELIINLKSKPVEGAAYTQLEFICSQIFAKVLTLVAEERKTKALLESAAKIKKNPFGGWKAIAAKPANVKKNWFAVTYKTLMKRHPKLEPSFLKVLLLYLFYPEKRLAAEQWLKGYTVDSDMVELLGIKDRSENKPEALEEEARKIILSLDEIILEYGGRLIVVFFDQLEGLHGEKVMEKFQDMLQMLTNRTRAMMPMAFFRGADWEQRFKTSLDDFIYKRLRGSEHHLQGCTKAQAMELIRLRLDMVLGDIKRPDPLYPFVPDHQAALDQILRAKYILPRHVVVRANKLLTKICSIETEAPDDDRIIRNAWKARYEEILANIEKYEPDEGRLTLALELYLRNRPLDGAYTVPVLKATSESVKYLDLEGEIIQRDAPPAKAAFFIDVERHHAAVAASLRRGVEYLAKKGALALYVRDARALFPEPPRWPGTNEKLEAFKNTGGQGLFLEEKDAAYWYALALLSFAMDAGDVIRDDGAILDGKALDAFLAKHVSGRTYPAFEGVDEYLGRSLKGKAKSDAAGLAEAATEILIVTPAKLMKAETLAEKLREKEKRDVPLETLLPELKKHDDRFSIIPAKDGVIVKLKLDWVHANA